MNTISNRARTCIATVPSHMAHIISAALIANYSIRDAHVGAEIANECSIFATLSSVVACDPELVAAHKHSMRIFVMGMVAGIKAEWAHQVENAK